MVGSRRPRAPLLPPVLAQAIPSALPLFFTSLQAEPMPTALRAQQWVLLPQAAGPPPLLHKLSPGSHPSAPACSFLVHPSPQTLSSPFYIPSLEAGQIRIQSSAIALLSPEPPAPGPQETTGGWDMRSVLMGLCQPVLSCGSVICPQSSQPHGEATPAPLHQ